MYTHTHVPSGNRAHSGHCGFRCVHIYIYTHIYIHTFINTHIYIFTHMYHQAIGHILDIADLDVYTHIHTHIYTHIYKYTCIYTHTHVPSGNRAHS